MTAPSMDEMLGAVDVVDPYPLWQSLLDGGPLVSADGSFALLSSYEHCDAVLRSSAFSSDRRNSTRWQAVAAAMSEADRARLERQRSFLFLDPPDHTRLRRLVSKAFTPRTVDRLVPLVESLTDDLLGPAGDSLEVVSVLAYPLPVAVISRMLGVPERDHVTFAAWSEVLAKSLDDTLSAADDDEIAVRRRAVDDFRGYFSDLCDQRRAQPQEDLLTALVEAEDDGDRLSNDELLSTAMLLLIAGHETTVNLIANGALALLRDDELRRQVAADPVCAAGLVEEVLRLDPPVQMTMRIPLDDVDLPGGRVRAGGTVVLLLAAAGRDPAQHPDPLRLDPLRTTQHLALSAGAHYCLGAPLARLEGRVALSALARRLEGTELDRLEYKANRVLRGPSVLQVRTRA